MKKDSWYLGRGIPVYRYEREPDLLERARFYVFGVLIATVIILALFVSTARAQLAPAYTNEQIADAIYLAEGGKKAKVAYGILSVQVKDEAGARKVCLNTVRNQKKRHAEHNCGFSFLECLQRRYAPIGSFNDPRNLNSNWLKNVLYFLGREK